MDSRDRYALENWTWEDGVLSIGDSNNSGGYHIPMFDGSLIVITEFISELYYRDYYFPEKVIHYHYVMPVSQNILVNSGKANVPTMMFDYYYPAEFTKLRFTDSPETGSIHLLYWYIHNVENKQ